MSRQLSAAVIIGRSYEDRRPFDRNCLNDLRKLHDLGGIILPFEMDCPVEVEYPKSLTELEGLKKGPSAKIVDSPYFEGILINVPRIEYNGPAGETYEKNGVELYIGEHLVRAGRVLLEREARSERFDSGLFSGHIVSSRDMPDHGDSYYGLLEVIAVYPTGEENFKYPAVVLPLIQRTKDVRIWRYTSQQNLRAQEGVERVREFINKVRREE